MYCIQAFPDQVLTFTSGLRSQAQYLHDEREAQVCNLKRNIERNIEWLSKVSLNFFILYGYIDKIYIYFYMQ